MTELCRGGQRHDLEKARPGPDVEEVEVAEHARVDLRRSAHGVGIGSHAAFPKLRPGECEDIPLADSRPRCSNVVMSDYPEGWYDDPNDGGRERYWNGEAWTEDVREKYPPGWYDDPKRFGAERYWDGSGWTHDVRFVTRLDDVYEAIAFRKKEVRLVVSGEHVAWGDESMRWDDVTGFDTVTTLHNGLPVSHIVTLVGDDRKLVMEIARGRDDQHTADGFATIVDQAYRLITPRVLNDLFTRADAGEAIEYEKVTLSPQGFAKSGKDPVPWSEYGGWRTLNAQFQIDRMKGEKPKAAVRVQTTQLGRWVLTALVDDFSSRYSKA